MLYQSIGWFKMSSIFLLCLANFLSAAQPNIVFILADDMGWSDLPVYGNPFHEAPHLDRLAAQGMRFTNAYAACPVCSPTRASIQSGQYPTRVGVIDFIPGHWRPFEEVTVPSNRTQHLPGRIVTVAESLKKAGYATGYYGKWHLGYAKDQMPSAQGYDDAYVYSGGGFYHPKFMPAYKSKPGRRLCEILTDMSIDFIENNQDRPFFLFLAHYDVHVSLDADQDLISKYQNKPKPETYPGNAIYAAMIEHVDNSVGRVLKTLDKLGLADNTMVVFYSDNGGLIARFDKKSVLAKQQQSVYKDSPLQYIASSNQPLRAEKGTVYEGGIRVPLLVRWPGHVAAGKTNQTLASSVDFYPTFLQMAGIKEPTEQVLDGMSLIPALCKNQEEAKRSIFWHYPVYHHDVPASAIRQGDWKLVQNLVDKSTALYHLGADIGENTDLTSLYPQQSKDLLEQLTLWQKDTKARWPVPNPGFDPDKRYEWGRHPSRAKPK